MTITIEKSGDEWIASDGQSRAVGESRAEAACRLLDGEAGELQAVDATEAACQSALRLIRFLTMGAPRETLKTELAILAGWIEKVG